MLKRCSRCRELKELSKFYKDRSCRDGHHYACKKCHKAYGDHSEQKTQERLLILSEYNKKYYKGKTKQKRKDNKHGNNVFEFDGLLGCSAIGRFYERIALNLFKDSVDVSGKNFLSPYDILINGYRVDVKMKNVNKSRNCWTFVQKKNKKDKVDAYLLFCCNNYKIVKIFLLPSSDSSFYLSLNYLDKYKDFEIPF